MNVRQLFSLSFSVLLCFVLLHSCTDRFTCETETDCLQGLICKEKVCQFCPLDKPSKCGSQCVNTQQDSDNCGACGRTCPQAQLCFDGFCACPGNVAFCSGKCVDLSSSPEACGSCENKCPSGQRCLDGSCTKTACSALEPPLQDCNGGCVDLQSHLLHCGKCGELCVEGQICDKGKCRCVQPLKLCNGRCVDIRSDWKNCGACGKSAGKGNVCAQGKAQPTCPSSVPYACFGGCYNLDKSNQHCGKCGRVCPLGSSCVAGKCVRPKDEKNEPEFPVAQERTLETFSDSSEQAQDGGGQEEPTAEQMIEQAPPKPCTSGASRPCYTGKKGCQLAADKRNYKCVGPCKAGTELCVDKKWTGKCLKEIVPKVESCNLVDDDCDGQFDEEALPCPKDKPLCIDGKCSPIPSNKFTHYAPCSEHSQCQNGHLCVDVGHGTRPRKSCLKDCSKNPSSCVGASYYCRYARRKDSKSRVCYAPCVRQSHCNGLFGATCSSASRGVCLKK